MAKISLNKNCIIFYDMNRKIVIVTSLLAAALIFVPGISSAINAQQITGVAHSDIQGTISKVPVGNATDTFGYAFLQWYGQNKLSEKLPVLNNYTAKSLFDSFIAQSSEGQILLKVITSNELSNFQKANKKSAEAFLVALENGSVPNSTSTAQSNGITTDYVIKLSSVSLPSGIPSDDGVYGMVQVNYFVYTAPWWLGGWSVTYGEHDVINALFAGNDGQNFYNSAISGSNDAALLDGFALGVISVGLAVSPVTAGLSALAAGIIAGAIVAAGLAITYFTVNFQNAMTNIYETSWADQPSGQKFMWIYTNVNYYYPSVTVVGVLASNVGIYGYEVSDNSLASITVIPWYDLSSPTYAAELSSDTQSAGSSHGWNSWYSDGDNN